MDDHAGFSTNCESMLRAEEQTIAGSDLVVVTSDVLHAKVRAKARRTTLIRNACDYGHFAAAGNPDAAGTDCSAAARTAACDDSRADVPSAAKRTTAAAAKHAGSTAERPTVGFYGAIAEWFDADLVADLAELRPGWKFELIGSTLTGDVSRLEKLPNVDAAGREALRRAAAVGGRLGLLHHPVQADSADRGHESGQGL